MTPVHSLEQLLQDTSDIAYRKEILKEVIYKASNLKVVGTKILPIRNLTNIDVKLQFPTERGKGAIKKYPVAENALPPFESIKWVPFQYTLEKFVDQFFITDEAVIRGQAAIQNQMEVRRVIENAAKLQDAEILDVVQSGASDGATEKVTIAGAAEWDLAAGDPEADIVNALTIIDTLSNVSDAELMSGILVAHVNVRSEFRKLQLINNVQQTLQQYLKASLGLSIMGTRDADFVDTAFIVIPGRETGEHGIYNGNAVPLVEQGRKRGVGQEYLIKKWFKSKIKPESDTKATSYRICKIENTHS